MSKIMIIGAGQFQIPLIKKCVAEGHFALVTDYDENAEGFKYANKKLLISTLDKEKTLNAFINNCCDAIITTSDYPVRTVAYVNEKLNLNGLYQKAAIISTDKYLMRNELKKYNIDVPEYCLITNYSELESKISNFRYPVVVKPVDSSASRGVKLVINNVELLQAYTEAFNQSKSGNVIIEEFIDGQEYSVESLTQNGKTYIIAITEKHTCGYPYFVETCHILPGRVESKVKMKIENIVERCIKAIGLDNSASHTELKIQNGEPIIIEIGARLGGDYITSDLIPLATGIDMLQNVINLSLGKEINVKRKTDKVAAVQFLSQNNYNLLQNNDEILKLYNISRFEKKDYSDAKLRSSLDRLGYYISFGKKYSELFLMYE